MRDAGIGQERYRYRNKRGELQEQERRDTGKDMRDAGTG
jgi:hypothetical protein